MTPTEVEALINAEITANGNNAITGTILNGVLQNLLSVQNRIVITCGSGGYSISNDNKTLTGPFLGIPITELTTNGSSLIINDAFDQDTDTSSITLTDGSSFVTGQKVLPKI